MQTRLYILPLNVCRLCTTSFTELGLREMQHALSCSNRGLQLPSDVGLNYTALVKHTTLDDRHDGRSRKQLFCAQNSF